MLLTSLLWLAALGAIVLRLSAHVRNRVEKFTGVGVNIHGERPG